MALSRPRRNVLVWANAQWADRVKERPAGSNRGPQVTAWQIDIAGGGHWLEGQPWCGVFAGEALKRGGVKITARIASVALIEDDAKAGINGMQEIVPVHRAMPGDLAIMFGRGVHVELVDRPHKRLGYFTNIGGNTSYEGAMGSQSNGGCVAKRHRPISDIYCVVRPRYPRR